MAMLTKHRKGKSPPKNQHVCTHCQKKGHTEEKCWIAHPELRPTKSGSSKKTSKALISMKATLKVESPSDPYIWYIDSGASVHFSPHRNKFESYTPLDNPIEIETAEGTIYGIGKGTITVEAMAGSDINILQLKNVVHVPKMSVNLLSSTVLYDLGFEVSMKPGQGVNILRNGEIIANTVRAGESVFQLKTPKLQAKTARTVRAESLEVWHKRLGHLGKKNVLKLETMADGIKITKDSTLGVCEDCQIGKQTRTPSHEPRTRADEPLGLIHADTRGRSEPPTREESNTQ